MWYFPPKFYLNVCIKITSKKRSIVINNLAPKHIICIYCNAYYMLIKYINFVTKIYHTIVLCSQTILTCPFNEK